MHINTHIFSNIIQWLLYIKYNAILINTKWTFLS